MNTKKLIKRNNLRGNTDNIKELRKGLDPDSKQVFPTGTKEFVASGEPKPQWT